RTVQGIALDTVVVRLQRGIQAFDGLQLLALGQADQGHALGVAADTRDFRTAGAHQRATIGNQQNLVTVAHQYRTDQLAVALAGLDADHTLGATTLARIIGQRGALAVAVLGGGKDVLRASVVSTGVGVLTVCDGHALTCLLLDAVVVLALVLGATSAFGHDQTDDFLTTGHLDTAHTGGGTSHRADLVLSKAHGLAVGGEQQDVALAIGQADTDQRIALIEVDGDLAACQTERE